MYGEVWVCTSGHSTCGAQTTVPEALASEWEAAVSYHVGRWELNSGSPGRGASALNPRAASPAHSPCFWAMPHGFLSPVELILACPGKMVIQALTPGWVTDKDSL